MHQGDLGTAACHGGTLASPARLGCRRWVSLTGPSFPLPECSTAFPASGSPFVSGRWVTPQTRWCHCSSLGETSRTSRQWLSLGRGHSRAGVSPWVLQSILLKDLDVKSEHRGGFRLSRLRLTIVLKIKTVFLLPVQRHSKSDWQPDWQVFTSSAQLRSPLGDLPIDLSNSLVAATKPILLRDRSSTSFITCLWDYSGNFYTRQSLLLFKQRVCVAV